MMGTDGAHLGFVLVLSFFILSWERILERDPGKGSWEGVSRQDSQAGFLLRYSRTVSWDPRQVSQEGFLNKYPRKVSWAGTSVKSPAQDSREWIPDRDPGQESWAGFSGMDPGNGTEDGTGMAPGVAQGMAPGMALGTQKGRTELGLAKLG